MDGKVMKTKEKSQAANLMDVFMWTALVLTVVCFGLYYGKIVNATGIMWVGVVSFTLFYQLKLRLILGDVTAAFQKHIHYKQRFFQELGFEKGLYTALRVKKWKNKVMTYEPSRFDMQANTLEAIANNMSKAELDHWNNQLISLSTLFFSLVWGAFPVFFAAALFAMIFDGQFIVIQRYNRPRIVHLLERKSATK